MGKYLNIRNERINRWGDKTEDSRLAFWYHLFESCSGA
jgi:hypothetical protein